MLVLDEIGHWPKPQILWAGPSSAPGDLPQLHTRLGDGLNALGFETEARAFRPHVTLARKVRNQPPVAPLATPELAGERAGPGRIATRGMRRSTIRSARWPLK